MSEQDALRKHLYDELDAVEATTKQLMGDKSREASKRQNSIIDGVNAMRHTIGAIPKPIEPAAEKSEAREASGAGQQPEQAVRANQASDGRDWGRAEAAGRASASSTEELEERG
jgi:hypothetical protein